MNKAIQAAALIGGCAVLTGAFGAHGLKTLLSDTSLEVWRTAVLYQFIHALALLGLGCMPVQKAWVLSFWAWVLGVNFFAAALCAGPGGAQHLRHGDTLGGLALCLGWFNLLRFKAGAV